MAERNDSRREGSIVSRDYATTVGASEVAAILGCDPWRTPEDVWRAKVLGERVPLNAHMLRGVCLESGILDWWERLPELEGGTRRNLVRNPREPLDERDPRQTDVLHPNGWAAATLDGWHRELRLVVEAKASAPSKKWNARTGEHPLHYRVQVVWQLGIAQAAGLDVVAGELIAGPMYGELWCFRVEPDDVLFRLALARCEEFMAYVKSGEPLPASFNGNTEAVQ